MTAGMLLYLTLFTFGAAAQSSRTIEGIVLDATTIKPIEYATISILPDTGSLPVTGGITGVDGQFSIAQLSAGSYRIITDFIGYRRDTLKRQLIETGDKKIDTIRLHSLSRTLTGVTVSASAPLIETKVDKIVFNAANDITAQGSTTLDLLRKVPQVTVDIDGNVELQGNPNIGFLINGKPSSIFGASLADALASIPASQIQRIEAITTPGARYDAQGTGGIINIILKESRVQGYNGSISLSAGSRLENGSFNLNVKRGAFGINAFFSGNAQLPSRTLTRQDRHSADTATNTTTQLLQDGYYDFDRAGYNGGLGAEWEVTKNNALAGGISVAHFGNHSAGQIVQRSITQDAGGAPVSGIPATRLSDSRFHTTSLDWNLGYTHSFAKEGRSLNAAYSASYAVPNASYAQSQMVAGQSAPFAGSRSNSPGTDRETNISVDYAQPLGEDASLECGVKTILQTIHSTADVSTLGTTGADYLSDPSQSFSLRYSMGVYAGYASATFRLGNWLDVKAGARYEYTDVSIDYPGTTVPAYSILAPTAIISHKWKSGAMLKLAYTRRIERAEYDELNPFVNRSDPYNLTTGNPLLTPEIGNNMELGWSRQFGKGGNLNISLIERINTDDHKRVIDFYAVYRVGDSLFQNVSVQNFRNAGTEYNTGINISGSIRIAEVLTLRGNAMLMNQYFEPSLPGLRSGIIGYRFRGNLNLTYQPPGSTFAAEAFGNYNAPSQNIQGRSQQQFSYTIALRKLFWNKKGSVGLTATNPFNEYVRQVTTISTPGYESYVERQNPYRSFGAVFSYKFGKLELKKEREEDRGYLNDVPGGGN